jgi:hypothetical protein
MIIRKRTIYSMIKASLFLFLLSNNISSGVYSLIGWS